MIRLSTPNSNARRIDEKIVPMINIIFLLLMFFLIAGNVSKLVREDVVPPVSTSHSVTASADTDWLLARDGTIVLRSKSMNLTELATWLVETGQQLPATVVLRADARARSGALLPLMKLLRDHGVEKVSLVTLNDNSGH